MLKNDLPVLDRSLSRGIVIHDPDACINTPQTALCVGLIACVELLLHCIVVYTALRCNTIGCALYKVVGLIQHSTNSPAFVRPPTTGGTCSFVNCPSCFLVARIETKNLSIGHETRDEVNADIWKMILNNQCTTYNKIITIMRFQRASIFWCLRTKNSLNLRSKL